MKRIRNIHRRKFLRFLLTIAAACASQGVSPLTPGPARAGSSGVRLKDVVHVPSAVSIGRAAMDAVPEHGVADLTIALRKSVPEGAADHHRVSPSSFCKHLATTIKDDFAAGRTVMLDGWVISMTEARLSVLAARAGGDHLLLSAARPGF